MSPTARRILAFAAAVSLAACGGSSTPPPPAASPTPGATDGDLRPLSSREAGPGASMPGGTGTPGEAGLPAGHPPIGDTSRDPNTVAAAGASVAGTITVSDDLVSRVSPGDVLYVMAKKGEQTLAVQRIGSPTFPMAFEVSEGHAMVAGAALQGPVDIVARLSKTGDAIPSAGDLEGTTSSVTVPASGVSVKIDQVLQ